MPQPSGGRGDRREVELEDDPDQVVETATDVVELRRGPPVLLGGKIDDVLGERHRPYRYYEHLTDLYIAFPASALVGLTIFGVSTLELECDTLPHDTHRIDGVHERFGIGLKQVSVPLGYL